MYERFTDRLRTVLGRANEAAQRLNRDDVDTEQILLALVNDHCGPAVLVLRNLGVSEMVVGAEIEVRTEPGPRRVEKGKLPLAPRTRRAIDFGVQEAKSMALDYVDTEHLLLGLLAESLGQDLPSIAASVLKRRGKWLTVHYQAKLGGCCGRAIKSNRTRSDPLARRRASAFGYRNPAFG